MVCAGNVRLLFGVSKDCKNVQEDHIAYCLFSYGNLDHSVWYSDAFMLDNRAQHVSKIFECLCVFLKRRHLKTTV